MINLKRCFVCNTSWPETELSDHGECINCRGEENKGAVDKLGPGPETAEKTTGEGKKPQLKLFE